MKIKSKLTATMVCALHLASPSAVLAADDPNAATNAETARLNAEAARINAEAALTKAKADKDKAAIDNLGLPSFANKTTLEEGGGAIETSMLATTAVQEAANTIKGKLPNASDCKPGNYIILPAGQSFNPNLDETMRAQIEYLTGQFQKNDGSRPSGSVATTGIAVISALAGLAGNEVTVTGVTLSEIDHAMLANAVAGSLGTCAIVPAAGIPKLDPSSSKLANALRYLVDARRSAIAWVNTLDKKDQKTHAEKIAMIAELTKEHAALEKALTAVNDQGVSLMERAMVVEKLKASATHIVTIKVNKAGGTITNSKNLGTFFGGDPVKVSGGLSASWSMMTLADGRSAGSGTLTCQTAQVKLREVQSGEWTNSTKDKKGATCS